MRTIALYFPFLSLFCFTEYQVFSPNFIDKELIYIISNYIVVSKLRERKWQPTPVFLPGESQRQRSLVGCHLWDCTESDTTEAT